MPYKDKNDQNAEPLQVNRQAQEDRKSYLEISTLIEEEYMSGPIQQNRTGDEKAQKALASSRVSFISSILDDVETTERLQLSEQEKERLMNVRSRGLSYLLLNENSRSDSAEMKEVKYRVGNLERLLADGKNDPATPEKLEEIEIACQFALYACNAYVNDPKKRENSRKQAVRRTAGSLTLEAEKLAQKREMLASGEYAGKTLGEVLNLSERDVAPVYGQQEEKGAVISKTGQMINNLFSIRFDPEEELRKAGDSWREREKVKNMYLEARMELNSIPQNRVVVRNITLLGKRVTILQRSDNSLSLVEGHQEFRLATTAGILADRIGEVFAPEEQTPRLNELRQKAEDLSYEGNLNETWVPKEAFKEWGGATKHKYMPASDAIKIEKKSGGYIAAVPCKHKGMMELRPSLPQKVKINGKEIELRRTYNYVLKALHMAILKKDGTFCENAPEIAERLEGVFMDSMTDTYKEQNVKEVMTTYILPEIKKSLMLQYQKMGKQVDRKAVTKEAGRIISDWITIQKSSKHAFLAENEIQISKSVSDLFKAQKGDFGDWEPAARDFGATDQEIEDLRAHKKEEFQIAVNRMNRIRDMDPEGKETPIQCACSAHAGFIQTCKLNYENRLVGKLVYYYHDDLLKNNPKMALEFMLKDFKSFAAQRELGQLNLKDLPDREIRFRGYLEKLNRGEKLTDQEFKDYYTFVTAYNDADYHVAGKVLSDTDGSGKPVCYTTEAFEKLPWQTFAIPFSMDGLVGEYKAANKQDPGVGSVPETDEEMIAQLEEVGDISQAIQRCRLYNEGMYRFSRYGGTLTFAQTRLEQINFRVNTRGVGAGIKHYSEKG